MYRTITILALSGALAFIVSSCKRAKEEQPAESEAGAAATTTHVHEDGATHAGNDGKDADGEDHAHDEVPLGTVTIGDLKVELAQGHGKLAAGKEAHLVVKLPYNDKGATIVRAWIGTADRFQSVVGRGEFAPAHGDYDIHAVTPDPLPEDVMWWIEMQKPDGTKVLGSAKPLLE